jgi:hypothetical protein
MGIAAINSIFADVVNDWLVEMRKLRCLSIVGKLTDVTETLKISLRLCYKSLYFRADFSF